MGQTLSEPVTDKITEQGSDSKVHFAVSSMQGWRISMEDAHTAELSLATPGEHSFFAVFDGHGGADVAKYCSKHLHLNIINNDFTQGKYKEALTQGFLTTDQQLKQQTGIQTNHTGCTGVTCLFTGGKIYTANAGDSRAIVCSKGTAIPLSTDHKPFNPEENSRIINAGGFVEFGRVNGDLALSRAFGDFDFKGNANLGPEAQAVTVIPEITEREIIQDDEFLVIACDGIWDCLQNQQVADFISHQLAQGNSLTQACQNIMDSCLAAGGDLASVGTDNMTIMIVALTNGNLEEWTAKIKQRVDTSGLK